MKSLPLQQCKKHSIDITYMRGQTHDNSANMSGKYNGMQAKLYDINPLALYVPCAAHSLNLIGVCAVESCVEATNFFSLVQKYHPQANSQMVQSLWEWEGVNFCFHNFL